MVSVRTSIVPPRPRPPPADTPDTSPVITTPQVTASLLDFAVSLRPLVVATATELARFTGQHLIAPQTILVRAYLEQIFAGLRDAGLDVFHVVLDAGEEILRQRIHGSAEAQAWRLDHLAEYRSSRAWMVQAADLAVDTCCRTPAEIAHQIAAALPGPMRTDTP
jgi:hypothetical protein